MDQTLLHDVQAFDGPKEEGSYIVVLKDGANKVEFLQHANHHHPEFMVTADWDKDFINGFAAKPGSSGLIFLRSHVDVLSIEEDGIHEISHTVSQVDATWGLARLSQDNKLHGSSQSLAWTFKYDDVTENVDIYTLDTGIRITHEDFEKRARWGKTFGPYKDQDGNGHGTHVAGIAAGHRWGVAKSANLIAVKVLSDKGAGKLSDVISGLNYVSVQVGATPSRSVVVNMSIGGGASSTEDKAITKLVNKGVIVVVGAGNSDHDAKNNSPARCADAITVGATSIDDARSSYSNFGNCVNMFAPGDNITSATNKNDTGATVKSGTSMATPFVSGLCAYLIARSGKKITPSDAKDLLNKYGIQNKLSNILRLTLSD